MHPDAWSLLKILVSLQEALEALQPEPGSCDTFGSVQQKASTTRQRMIQIIEDKVERMRKAVVDADPHVESLGCICICRMKSMSKYLIPR